MSTVHTAMDTSWWSSGPGVAVILMAVLLVFSMVRYNLFTRPQEDRELADEREEERRAHEAEREAENDVPL